jgi:hypothetical protein
MTTAEAARILRIAPVTVRAHIKSHVLAATWDTNARRWDISDEAVARFAVERKPAHRPRKKEKPHA